MLQGPRSRMALLILSWASVVGSLPLRLVAETGAPRPQLLQREGLAASENAPPYDFDSGGLKPNGHFNFESASSARWPRERQKFRRRLLSSSERHAAELKKLGVDDKEDSFLWGELSDFKAEDTSKYWDALCNGTNMSKSNKLPGDAATSKLNVTVVLSSWQLADNNTCSEFVGDEYTDALKAFKDCGATCDGLSDTGRNMSKIRLCALGGNRKASNTSRVFNKPADFVSPKGQPRPPIELGFWRDFCVYRLKGRSLRIMHEGQNCLAASVKALTKATNPVECMELAAKDTECAEVFDFRFGPPPVCRCLKKDMSCAPAVSTGGHVYAPSMQ